MRFDERITPAANVRFAVALQALAGYVFQGPVMGIVTLSIDVEDRSVHEGMLGVVRTTAPSSSSLRRRKEPADAPFMIDDMSKRRDATCSRLPI